MGYSLRMTDAEWKAHQERVRRLREEQDERRESDAAKRKPKADAVVMQRDKPASQDSADAASRPDPQYEQWLYNQLVAAGVVGIERQYHWCRGRKYLADLAVPDKRLIVELEGGVHTIRKRWKDDILKGQAAILQGWTLLRIANDQVRSGDAARIVQNVLTTLMAQRAAF